MERMRRIGSSWAIAGFLLGALVGAALLASSAIDASADSHAANVGARVERGLRDVLHNPPLLVERGAKVTLRYDAVCQADAFGEPCALVGSVYVRPTNAAAFSRVPLELGSRSVLTAAIPASATAGDGFSYYAVISDGIGSEVTVPAGGAVASQRAWVVPRVPTVDLGTHVFGRPVPPDELTVRAPWGSGNGALGLLTGHAQSTIGPAAFDLAPDGSTVVLDEVNKRLAIYPPREGSPRYVAIPFSGGDGDLTVGADGTMYVLDGAGSAAPVVRSFTPAGAPLGAARVGMSGVDMLRAAPGGAVAHGYPGDMWLPVGRAGTLIQPTVQAAAARAGRSVDGGAEVVVKATQAGARFALVRGDRVLQAWHVTSATPLGEVQLAERLGDALVAVVRVWTEKDTEFVVLVLSPTGLAASFSLAAVEWAESSALGRFRLSGEMLHQLRSARDGVEIATFDLGGVR